MSADSTIPRPPHFCWVDVTNLPADEKLVIEELKKFGWIKTLEVYPVRHGTLNVMAQLPDVPSAEKFATNINEKIIGGRTVYAAKRVFLTELKRMSIMIPAKSMQDAGTPPQPPIFHWVDVVNLPANPALIRKTVLKMGDIQQYTLVQMQGRGGTWHMLALLPDIRSSQKFASEINEKKIGGRTVYAARRYYLNALAEGSPGQKVAGTVDTVTPSVVELLEKNFANAPKAVTPADPPSGLNASAIITGFLSSAPSTMRKPVIHQPKPTTTQSRARSVTRAKQSGNPVQTPSRRIVTRSQSVAKTNVAVTSATTPSSPMKQPINQAKIMPAEDLWVCDRKGCRRYSKPYKRETAFHIHMAQHDAQGAGKVKAPKAALTPQKPTRRSSSRRR